MHVYVYIYHTGNAILNQADFLADVAIEDLYVSKIWRIPGMHLSAFKPDWMHVVDLGVLQYFQGNCFWELYQELGGGRSTRRPSKKTWINWRLWCRRVHASSAWKRF